MALSTRKNPRDTVVYSLNMCKRCWSQTMSEVRSNLLMSKFRNLTDHKKIRY